jgi:hypothetical protein
MNNLCLIFKIERGTQCLLQFCYSASDCMPISSSYCCSSSFMTCSPMLSMLFPPSYEAMCSCLYTSKRFASYTSLPTRLISLSSEANSSDLSCSRESSSSASSSFLSSSMSYLRSLTLLSRVEERYLRA